VLWFLIAESAAYAWRRLKDGAEVLLGRKRYFDERGLLLRQYVLHATGLRPRRAITCFVAQPGRGPPGSMSSGRFGR